MARQTYPRFPGSARPNICFLGRCVPHKTTVCAHVSFLPSRPCYSFCHHFVLPTDCLFSFSLFPIERNWLCYEQCLPHMLFFLRCGMRGCWARLPPQTYTSDLDPGSSGNCPNRVTVLRCAYVQTFKQFDSGICKLMECIQECRLGFFGSTKICIVHSVLPNSVFRGRASRPSVFFHGHSV